MYQLPIPYGCRDIARTRFSNSRSLRQGQMSNQGQTMTLHTYTPQPMSLPSMNFLHLTVSEIQPGQTISRRLTARPPAHLDTTGENNTPTALKGCGVKNCLILKSSVCAEGSQTSLLPYKIQGLVFKNLFRRRRSPFWL